MVYFDVHMHVKRFIFVAHDFWSNNFILPQFWQIYHCIHTALYWPIEWMKWKWKWIMIVCAMRFYLCGYKLHKSNKYQLYTFNVWVCVCACANKMLLVKCINRFWCFQFSGTYITRIWTRTCTLVRIFSMYHCV